MKSVPVRVCRQDRPFTQEPVPAIDANGEETTLGAFLKTKFPELIKETAVKGNYVAVDCAVVVQGIRPPLNTPLVWLANNLSHPDNFVYISMVPSQK